MKRTLATLGAVGLAALAVAAPATADNNNKSFCHAVGNGYLTVSISSSGFEGHDRHDGDIIPPGEGLPDGLNWDTGKAIFANGCVATVPAPPVVVDTPVTPPAEEPVVVDQPVVEQPVVVDNSVPEQPVVQPLTEAIAETPSVEAPAEVATATVTAQPAPAKQVAAAPKAAPKAAPAAAPVSVGTNQGYNAQTAVGAPDAGPGWLAGAAALAAAGAAVAVRRRPRLLHTGG
ncbi:hypothetical protein [Arthrobacter sp. B1I2]|uniref:hypothetical protein n=1 Tax=Arthrobacter sp. B1I2 TaxID=3042263 RepID=UPI00277E5A5C|nr:hypothetical protein [Arthrobacter sp. B1I2]MDQ0730271.1 hypothetical protein [Arthrobacter sp. B1I2]